MKNIPYEKHVLVCTHEHCKKLGSEETFLKLKEKIKGLGLKPKYRPSRVICLGKCDKGPNVAVWPEGTMYCGFKENNIDELIEKHLLKEEVLTSLLLKEGCGN